MSILSISATHFAHETETSVGREMLGIEWDAKRARLKELSRKFKKAALCNVYLGTGGDDPHQSEWQVPAERSLPAAQAREKELTISRQHSSSVHASLHQGCD